MKEEIKNFRIIIIFFYLTLFLSSVMMVISLINEIKVTSIMAIVLWFSSIVGILYVGSLLIKLGNKKKILKEIKNI